MDNKIPVRYNFMYSEITTEDNGDFMVSALTRQGLNVNGDIILVREFAVKAFDKDIQKAHMTTAKSIASLLAEYEGDFFSKKEWEYTQYQLPIEKQEKGEIDVPVENDKDTEIESAGDKTG